MRSSKKTRYEEPALHGIYASALAPEQWPDALRLVAEDLSAVSAFFFSTHSDTEPGAVLHVHNHAAEMLQEFGSYWHTEDEWALAARRKGFMTGGSVVLGSELVPRAQLVKTAFYNGFCLPHGMDEMVGTVVFDAEEGDRMPFTNLCMYRPPNQPPFQAWHKNRLQGLLPHFRRAMRIQRRVASVTNEQAKDALGAIHVASVVLDSHGGIRNANPAGQDFLRTLPAGCVRFGQLRAIGSRSSPLLREALARCRVTDPVRIAAYLPQPHPVVIGATLLCLPLGSHGTLGAEGRERYLLLVDLPRADGHQIAAAVSGLFGLSGAEVRVLGALLDGKAPGAIAVAHGTSLPTIRTQISSLLNKTSTRGQSELLLLLRGIQS